VYFVRDLHDYCSFGLFLRDNGVLDSLGKRCSHLGLRKSYVHFEYLFPKVSLFLHHVDEF